MQLVGSHSSAMFISCSVKSCDKKYVEILTRTNGSTGKKGRLPTFVRTNVFWMHSIAAMRFKRFSPFNALNNFKYFFFFLCRMFCGHLPHCEKMPNNMWFLGWTGKQVKVIITVMLTPWEYSESTQVLYWNHNKDYIEKRTGHAEKAFLFSQSMQMYAWPKGFFKTYRQCTEVHKHAIMSWQALLF